MSAPQPLYVEHLNRLIGAAMERRDRFIVYGQNVGHGPCLGGLTRGLPAGGGRRVIDTINAENTLVGFGFGLMLNGVDSAFCMKQQDFLLLGIDQLVNTWAILRHRRLGASYTILSTIVDSGFEGPQSSLNAFYDFCSFARIPGYTITNRRDADLLMTRQFGAPGFRLIGLSQRLYRQPLLDPGEPVLVCGEGDALLYRTGRDATLLCSNLSLPQGLAIAEAAAARGRSVTLGSINAAHVFDTGPLMADIERTRRLILLDDCRSPNKPYAALLAQAAARLGPERVTVYTRSEPENYAPNPDLFEPPVERIMGLLGE